MQLRHVTYIPSCAYDEKADTRLARCCVTRTLSLEPRLNLQLFDGRGQIYRCFLCQISWVGGVTRIPLPTLALRTADILRASHVGVAWDKRGALQTSTSPLGRASTTALGLSGSWFNDDKESTAAGDTVTPTASSNRMSAKQALASSGPNLHLLACSYHSRALLRCVSRVVIVIRVAVAALPTLSAAACLQAQVHDRWWLGVHDRTPVRPFADKPDARLAALYLTGLLTSQLGRRRRGFTMTRRIHLLLSFLHWLLGSRVPID